MLRAFVWFGLVDVGLRALGLRRLVALAPSAPAAPPRRLPPYLRDYVAALNTVGRWHPVQAHCLHKSVVLHFWLRREGLPSVLQIGVRKEKDALRAHAWVELGGLVVNDDPSSVTGFTPLRSSPTAGIKWTSSVGHA